MGTREQRMEATIAAMERQLQEAQTHRSEEWTAVIQELQDKLEHIEQFYGV